MTQVVALKKNWSLLIKNTWVLYQLDIFVVLLLIPVSIKCDYEMFWNKLFRVECMYLEYPHRNAQNFSRKHIRNTFKIIVLETTWRDLFLDTLKSKFGSEVAKTEENGLQVYGLYGNYRIYTYTVHIYGVYWFFERKPHSPTDRCCKVWWNEPGPEECGEQSQADVGM